MSGTPTPGNVDNLISDAGRGAADALLSLSTDTGGSGGPQGGGPSAQGPTVSGTGLNGTGTGVPPGAAGGAVGSGGPAPTSGGGALGSGAAPGAAASTGLTREDLVDALRMALEHPSGANAARAAVPEPFAGQGVTAEEYAQFGSYMKAVKMQPLRSLLMRKDVMCSSF